MRRPIKRGKVMAEINITPFTDVVLVLLIIFMVSTPLLLQPGIKIKLPKAEHSETQKNEQVIVVINKEEEIFINEDKVLASDLPAAIRARLAGAESRTVVIRADKEVQLGLAVKVMDIAKEAKADGIVITTETGQDETDK